MRRTLLVALIAVLALFVFMDAGRMYRGYTNPKKKLNYKPKFIERPYGPKIAKEPAALPNEWMGYQRMYPAFSMNMDAHREELRKAADMKRQSSNRIYEWELVGPANIGGRITDIEIHPDEPETWYIGAATGGMYKTTDNGSSFVNVFTDLPTISVGDIAIDPNDTQVLYVGTGEANSSSQSFFGSGVYKSTDAGETWESSGLENSIYIGRMIVDYNDSQRVFAAVCGNLFSPNPDRGVYRSVNGGAEWERVLFVSDSTSAIDLVQHPQNPQILYAAMWERIRGRNYRKSGGPSSGIYKTEDGGDTWVELTNGLPLSEYVGRIGLCISHSDPDVLYAFYDKQMQSYESFSFDGLYRTSNGGASWARTDDSSLDDINASFGWYFGQVRVDPSDPDRIYALGVDLVRSDDGGDSYDHIAGYWNSDEIHVDHHAMVIDPNTGRIVEGNDGGLYVSYNYGDDWAKINVLPMTQFYAIEIDQNHPERRYGGTQDNNSIRTFTGASDDWIAFLGGDGFYVKVDEASTDQEWVYAESQYGELSRVNPTTGSGHYLLNNQMQSDRKNWSTPIETDSNNPGTIYYGSYRVWKSTNSGNTWTAISEDLTQGNTGGGYNTLTTIAVSAYGDVLTGSDDGQVYYGQSGTSWANISDGLPDRWITRVAFDPFEPTKWYATVSGFRWDEDTPHVFRYDFFDQAWTDISSNLPQIPVNVILPDPLQENVLFVGTDCGVYYTLDGGNNWESLSENLPNVPIIDLDMHVASHSMYAGTYGCSMYRIDELPQLSVDTQSVTQMPVRLNQNSPNPFSITGGSQGTAISFSIPKAAKVDLSIYNVRGQKIKVLRSDRLEKGDYSLHWDGTDSSGKSVSSGVYLYRLDMDGKKVAVRKCTVIK